MSEERKDNNVNDNITNLDEYLKREEDAQRNTKKRSNIDPMGDDNNNNEEDKVNSVDGDREFVYDLSHDVTPPAKRKCPSTPDLDGVSENILKKNVSSSDHDERRSMTYNNLVHVIGSPMDSFSADSNGKWIDYDVGSVELPGGKLDVSLVSQTEDPGWKKGTSVSVVYDVDGHVCVTRDDGNDNMVELLLFPVSTVYVVCKTAPSEKRIRELASHVEVKIHPHQGIGVHENGK